MQVRVLPCRLFYLHVFEFPPEHTRHRAAVGPGVVSVLDVELRAALVEVRDRVFALVLLVVVGEQAVPVRSASVSPAFTRRAAEEAVLTARTGSCTLRAIERGVASEQGAQTGEQSERRPTCQLVSRWQA